MAVGIYFICRGLFYLASRKGGSLHKSSWHRFLTSRKLGRKILLMVPGILLYFLLYTVFRQGDPVLAWLHKVDIIYMVAVTMIVGNSALLTFLDLYSNTEKNRTHPLKGLIQGLQVALFFIGGILIVAILIDKSPTALLTGLGASAAVLMLIFKDSILGFVAGVQLSQNNMIRIGDWIQMPDGSANGTVEEITLNTVKVRNWDNTISTVPPYTLVSTTFKNWRGMSESEGRRVDKKIFLDLDSVKFCNAQLLEQIRKDVPMIADNIPDETPTNAQLYRIYIAQYLRQHPVVAKNLDLIIAQREPTQYGLPIEVYFFLSDKVWSEYESIQSDIFDHLLAMAPAFGLRLYQLNFISLRG